LVNAGKQADEHKQSADAEKNQPGVEPDLYALRQGGVTDGGHAKRLAQWSQAASGMLDSY
jgi:hypothetical protein